jgi:hypothetical protein
MTRWPSALNRWDDLFGRAAAEILSVKRTQKEQNEKNIE